jgi:hypothetical protein
MVTKEGAEYTRIIEEAIEAQRILGRVRKETKRRRCQKRIEKERQTHSARGLGAADLKMRGFFRSCLAMLKER